MNRINQNLQEWALIEGNQQAGTKPDELLSPSLFTIRSRFATIHHYVAQGPRGHADAPDCPG
jgi:hypothetical protein